MDESKNAAGMSAEEAELHQQGVRIAKSYFRYRGAEILSAEADNADAPDICCTVDEGTVLADVVAVTNIDVEEEVPELSVKKDDFWRCRRRAFLWLAEHRVSSVRYDLISVGIFGQHHARIRHLAGVFFWSDEPDQLSFYPEDRD